MQQNNSQIIHQVNQELLAANISITTELAELFSDASNIEPFAGLDTEYLQTKYYKENFRLLVSLVQYIYNTIQLFYLFRTFERFDYLLHAFVAILYTQHNVKL